MIIFTIGTVINRRKNPRPSHQHQRTDTEKQNHAGNNSNRGRHPDLFCRNTKNPQSRLLAHFPFLLEIGYWLLIYWVWPCPHNQCSGLRLDEIDIPRSQSSLSKSNTRKQSRLRHRRAPRSPSARPRTLVPYRRRTCCPTIHPEPRTMAYESSILRLLLSHCPGGSLLRLLLHFLPAEPVPTNKTNHGAREHNRLRDLVPLALHTSSFTSR